MTTTAAENNHPQGETWAAAARDTVSSWREMLDRRTAGRDVMAGISTAMVALPLNVALALACGLPPSVGLVTGAVAGVLSAVLGGARLQVTGPEVALAPLTFAIVSEHGFAGLLTATFLAGLIQIALGVLRVGRFVRAVPSPVIGGFMAAVGLLVFNSQLPRLLGLADVRVLSEMRGPSALASAGAGTIAVGALAVGALLVLPKVHKRIPAPMVAMAVGVVAVLLGVSTPTLAPIESVAPSVGLPHFHVAGLSTLIPEAIALALLASLDSLLCAAGMDARTGGPRVRTDQELVAQGIANMASACVGGMPVAAAIVRSMAAYEAGAATRLAPLVQSVVLALVLVLLAPFLPLVPIAALAGILLVVGYRLIDWRSLIKMYAASRAEAAIFLATAVAILATDFVTGVGAGILLAVLDFARRSARIEVSAGPAELHADVAPLVSGARAQGACLVRLEGPLFFGSHGELEGVLARAGSAEAVLLDLSGVRHADMTGALSLARIVATMTDRGAHVHIQGARPSIRPLLDAAGLAPRVLPEDAAVVTEEAPAAHATAAHTTAVHATAVHAAGAHATGAPARPEAAKPRRGAVRRPHLQPHLQPSLE